MAFGTLLSVIAVTGNVAAAESSQWFNWTKLSNPREIIDVDGYRLATAGDVLIAVPVDGNRPEATLSGDDAGPRTVRVLAYPEAAWQEANVGEAGTTISFVGAALMSYGEQVLCLGGELDGRATDTAVSLQYVNGRFDVVHLPPLPEPITGGCGAVLNEVVYVAGGYGIDGRPKRVFWVLDLAKQTAERGWKSLEPWPGSARGDSAIVAQDQSLLLFGGQGPGDGSKHLQQATTLQDAYRFTPGRDAGWKPIAHLPQAVNAPIAISWGPSHVLILSRSSPLDQSALAYHSITDTWRPIELARRIKGRDDNSVHTRNEETESQETALPLTPNASEPRADATEQPTPETLSAVWWQGGLVLHSAQRWFFGQPQRITRGLSVVDCVVLFAYLGLMILMAMYFSRRSSGTDDYFLAGRRIPWWAAGISLFGTSISSLTFMAIPALVYRTDWVYLIGNLMIVAVVPVIIRYYLPFYHRLKIISAYEYLEMRFGIVARLLAGITFMLYQLGRMGVVVLLPSLALSAVTGWNVYACILAIGVLATLYTTLGGIEAVIWTDVLQVVVLVGGTIASCAVIVTSVPGGAQGILAAGLAEGKFHAINLTADIATTALWVVVLGNFFKFLIPYSSDQATIQRYLTTSDEKQAARSVWLNAFAAVPIWTIFFGVGTALWAFYRVYPQRLDPMARTDEIFAWFIVHELPIGVAGLVVAALFAASMSTLDSGMNSMATIFTTDFYRRFHQQASDRRCLQVARWSTMLFGVAGTLIAVYLAMQEAKSIWDQFLKIMGLFGGGLAGMFMAAIFTRQTHQAGIVIGFAASAAVLYRVQASGAVHFFLYGAIGIFTCAIIGWLASVVIPFPAKNLDGLTIYSLRDKD